MRILAIGDIHGCSQALDALLAEVQLRPDDHLVTLGDYVDRGPDSAGVLDRLLALRNTNHLVPLRGNHDWMMVQARTRWDESSLNWLLCGGQKTLESYRERGDSGTLDDVPPEHWDFLENGLRDWYETETHIFVHGCVCPDMDMADQPAYMLHWEPLEVSSPHKSGKLMICGHSAQRSGKVLDLGHAIGIDTWVYGEGWLTCLDVRSGKVWQANQQGLVRSGRLDDLS
jgi:serine/threonine protein phosphatase 1